jgi:hypothetical protein
LILGGGKIPIDKLLRSLLKKLEKLSKNLPPKRKVEKSFTDMFETTKNR